MSLYKKPMKSSGFSSGSEIYNKSETIYINGEVSKFVQRLPILTTDAISEAFEQTSEL